MSTTVARGQEVAERESDQPGLGHVSSTSRQLRPAQEKDAVWRFGEAR